jgi:hypothetical protein
VWRPAESTTGRPAWASSKAIWTPEADAPTTRTPPSGRLFGERYAAAVSWATSGAGAPARRGMLARLWYPVATTTQRADQTVSSVRTAKPVPARCTLVTSVCGRTGASNERA